MKKLLVLFLLLFSFNSIFATNMISEALLAEIFTIFEYENKYTSEEISYNINRVNDNCIYVSFERYSSTYRYFLYHGLPDSEVTARWKEYAEKAVKYLFDDDKSTGGTVSENWASYTDETGYNSFYLTSYYDDVFPLIGDYNGECKYIQYIIKM